MPHDPIEALIRRLAGSEPSDRSDRDPAADHMGLAAYLDGGMTAEEKAAFEQELAQSSDRREEALSAVAWFDEIDAGQQAAPDHLVRQALALDVPPSRRTADAWWHGWLPASGRQWGFAVASAVASILIALVALQIIRNAPGPSFKLPEVVERKDPVERKPAVTTVRRTPMEAAAGKQGTD